MTSIIISFSVCFTVGFVLSVVLMYRDVKAHKPNGMNESLGHHYFWERFLAVLFDACQAGLSVAGIIAVVFLLLSKGDMYWVDMALGRILRVLMFPRWATWLTYIITILTAPNFVYPRRRSSGCFAYDSEPLYLSAAISLLSSAISRGRLEDHAMSGSEHDSSGYKRLLMVFIVTNAIAASFQLCGAIAIYSISLAESNLDTSLRQGVFLVCLDHRCYAI
ncbi:hypothetical protein T440DRAFT_410714 [Plenodomus tracheiphilus IPT5]|uniref:Uncharacterized protein n=1 Tax=Plenodomus tracheiphilus IPT5 TaxID=1408161 RepID=A0A6A7APU3_9PLEO|nr:hypothetical protein T440DRAFT_410714 [Plenodomus tracheiphilus IPT5]